MQAERRVARGGAIVRTVEGEVDATLATKLARAREAVEDELRAPRPPCAMAELVLEQGGAILAPEAEIAERLAGLGRAVSRADLHRRHGRVMDLIGLIVEATGLEAEVGEVCDVAHRPRPADRRVDDDPGRGRGLPLRPHVVDALGRDARHRPGRHRHRDRPPGLGRRSATDLLGRVLDGLGDPIDGGGSLGRR